MAARLVIGIEMFDDNTSAASFRDQMATRWDQLNKILTYLEIEHYVIGYHTVSQRYPVGDRQVYVVQRNNPIGRMASMEHLSRKDDVLIFIGADIDLSYTNEIAEYILCALHAVVCKRPLSVVEVMVESKRYRNIRRGIVVFSAGDILPFCNPAFAKGAWFRSAFAGISETTESTRVSLGEAAISRLTTVDRDVSVGGMNRALGQFIDSLSDPKWCAEHDIPTHYNRTIFVVAPSYKASGQATYSNTRAPQQRMNETVDRIWGAWLVQRSDKGVVVKKLWIRSRLSLQFHLNREERMEVLEGVLRVCINGVFRDVRSGDPEIVIKPGDVHFLDVAPGEENVVVIEKQISSVEISEDDIIRLTPARSRCD